MAEVAQTLRDPPARICRDPEDDYLIAQAVMAEVDFLITRDRDLLALGAVASVRIVDPVAFLELLRAESG
jgi:predicted nucleic acid-binding protein